MSSAAPTRIGFVLLSNSARPQPSTRIAVLNIFPQLRAAGYEPVIVFEPETATETPDLTGLAERMQALGIAIAYFQKVHGPSVMSQLAALRRAGIPTVYGVCDRVDDALVRATDATAIVTDFLKRQHAPELQARIHVVHDGIEHPELCCQPRAPARDGRLRAALVTSSALEQIPELAPLPSFLDLTVIGRYPEQLSPLQALRGRLRRALQAPGGPRPGPLFGYGFRTRAWQAERVYDDLRQADIGIIPVDMRPDPLPGRDLSYWEVKSENRLTLKMALGLPVVASPVPAYLDLIEQGVNGYLARTRAEWLDALEALRDPAHRRQVGAAARQSVLERFSMDAQARQLIKVFQSLAASLPAPA